MDYLADITERFIPKIKIRKDYLGIADIIALGDKTTILVQCTTDTGGQYSKHLNKINKSKYLKQVKDRGHRVQLWAWALKGKAGKRKVWTPRIYEF